MGFVGCAGASSIEDCCTYHHTVEELRYMGLKATHEEVPNAKTFLQLDTLLKRTG